MPELCDSEKNVLFVTSLLSLLTVGVIIAFIVLYTQKQSKNGEIKFPSQRLGWIMLIAIVLLTGLGTLTGVKTLFSTTKICDQIAIVQINCGSIYGDKDEQEFVVLQNLDDHVINLAQWRICDYKSEHCYMFQPLRLAPRARVTVWTGFGNDKGNDLHWFSAVGIWDDGNDVASLVDKKNRLVGQLACPPIPTPTLTPTKTPVPTKTPTPTPLYTATIPYTATPEIFVRYEVASQGYPSIGPVDAPITIVEFSDYQCPFCRRWHQEVYRSLFAAYPGQIRFVYRHMPLTSIHPDAFPAAEAAMCAGEQNAYWQFHDKLFSSDALGNDIYIQYAQDLSLNMAVFKSCIIEHKFQSAVQTDLDFAVNLGVRSTPTFFINGLAIVGAQPLDIFKQVIDKELTGETP